MKKTFNKIFITLILVMLMCMSCKESAYASSELPYDTYNYDYRKNIVKTPAAYIPTESISGSDLLYKGKCIGNFITPQDICVSDNGYVYVADTGNNRIVVLNSAMTEVKQIIDTFTHDKKEDTFKTPSGVCVSQSKKIYVADTGNKRVVIFTLDGDYIGTVQDPQSEILDENFDFSPVGVTVDYADRVYCIAKGKVEGITVFENDGEFTGFFGTIQVKISLWQKFWRKIATKEERSKQKLFIPTEFTGIDVDDRGFIYASNIDSDGVQAVRRLNPKGEDVIHKGLNKNVGGDLYINGTSEYSGPSEIIDVVYRDNGMYSLLDRKRGRIFTYDHEGNLLYIFGGIGTQAGTFSAPSAIEIINNNIIVIDSLRCEIMTFEATNYGELINSAVALRYDGNEKQAIQKWEKVLMLDENNELANTGIGKAYLTAGDNKKAMHYLKIGMNRQYYSIAFKRYRNELLKKNLNYILTVIIILIVGKFIYKLYKKNRKIK